jgi:hypothetical protein
MRNPIQPAIVATREDDQIAQLLSQVGRFPRPGEYAENVAHALESWPSELMALSFPSAGFELSQNETELLALLWGQVHLGLEQYPTAEAAWTDAAAIIAASTVAPDDGPLQPLLELPLVADLVARIDALLAQMIETHPSLAAPMFKLGTRSPKDSPFATVAGGRVTSGAQVFLLLLTSTRMMQDIVAEETYSKLLTSPPTDLHSDIAARLGQVPAHRYGVIENTVPHPGPKDSERRLSKQ